MLTITEPRTYAEDLDLNVCKKILCSCGLGDSVLGDQSDLILSLYLNYRTIHCFVCQWHPVCSSVTSWHVDLPTLSFTAIFQLGHVRRPTNPGRDRRIFCSQNFNTGSGTTQPPIQRVPLSISGGKAAGAWCSPLTPSSANIMNE